MEKIATDIFTFANLRGPGFTYVDKTGLALPLVNLSIGKQFFLSRPRRFGKSLLISTLKALFEGRRELFAGLAIEPVWDWTQTWPVIHLDLGSCQASDSAELRQLLNARLRFAEEDMGLPPYRPSEDAEEAGDSLAVRFESLCRSVAAKSKDGKIVILIDEYDKPLLGLLGTPEVTPVKNLLKKFYSVIKTCEILQRFTLITGVSKFSKVSIFSDLNNLTDISMNADFATLLGYTKDEVRENFPERLKALAEENGLSGAEAFARLERMYDGFKFHANAERVFNPVSVGKCLAAREFGSYWFETGTPTFLVELLKRNPVDDSDLRLDARAFGTFEPEQVRMLPLMYQTGYLTIKDVDTSGENPIYTLGYPNREVEDAMSYHLSLGLSCLPDDDFGSICNQIVDGLRAGEPDEMLEGVKCFFENIPYDLQVKYEKYYQSLFVSIFLMLKARVSCEVKTARGRIDAVIETPRFVYVLEFKVRGTAEEALAQIAAKGYAAKYSSDPRKVFRIGCAFDWEKRNLGKWIVEADWLAE